MVNTKSQYGKIVYNYVELILDDADDLITLSTDYAVGSTAFVIETSKSYMLNSRGEWKEVTLTTGGGGGGNSPSNVIYEGGVVTG